MRMRDKKRNVLVLVISLIFFMTACAGGNDGGDSQSLQTPIADLTGTWTVQETINGDCQEENYPEIRTDTYIGIQTGNNLSITISSTGTNISGTISGNNVTWEGSIPDRSGTLAIDFSGTVSADGNTITGTGTWTWTYGSDTCSGTAEVTATKESADTVVSGNSKPVANNQTVNTTEDTPIDITLTANDADGDALTWHIDSQPASGILSGFTPVLTYTPDAGFSGSDSFTFHVNDGTLDSDIATLSITISKKIGYKQFEETSYYLKDVCFNDLVTGWAVGEPHWDQATKAYTGTIIKTTDGGDTWTPQTAGLNEALRGVDFVDENNGWVVGANGTILRTGDGGNNWIQQTVATYDEFRGVVFTDVDHGWATSIQPVHYDHWGETDGWRGSIWNTSDGGETWTQQTVPDNAGILNRIDFIDSDNGWAVGIKIVGYDAFDHPEHVGVVYYTDDGGETWEEHYSPELDIVFTGVDFVDENNGWVVGFKGSSSIEGGTVFHTTDGGITWERQEPSYTLWDVHFLDSNTGYAVGAMYGAAWGPPVLRTLDGGATWETVRMERHDGEGLYGVAVVGDHVIAVGDHDFLGKSTRAWDSCEWVFPDEPPCINCDCLFEQFYINVHYRFEDVLFVDENNGWVTGKRSYEPSLWGQVILATNTGGTTWETQYEHAPPDMLFSHAFRVDSIVFTNSQKGWAVGGSETFDNNGWENHGAILHTEDGGLTWEEQGEELYNQWNLEFFAVQFLDSQNGWALNDGHFDPDVNGQSLFLAHTTNGGLTWEWVPTGIQGSMSVGFADVQGDLVFIDAQHAWAVGGLGKVIHTEDGGATWVQQELPSEYSRLFAVDFIDNQVGWIAGEGLYHTTDGGNTWIEQDTGVGVDFQDIQFLDCLNGWLVGNSGILMNTSDGGNSWNMVNSGTSLNLRGLSFISPQKGWLAGDYGTIIAVENE